MKKRIISVMLALILVMSGIPAQVFAQDPIEGVGATEDYSGEKSGLTAVTITGAGAKAVTNYAVSGSYESILDQLAEDDYEAYMHGRAKYQFMGTAAKLFPSEAEDWLAPAEFYVPATGETSTHEIRFFGDKDLDPDKLWFTTYATDTETPYNVEIISPFTEFVYGDGDGTLYIYTATISIPDREPTLDGDIALQVWYDGSNLIKSIPIHHVSNLDSLIQPYVTTYLITEYTESEEYICDTVTIEFSGFNLPSTLGSYDIGFLETTYDDETGGPIFDRSIAEPLSLSGPDETGKRTITFRFADHDDPVQLQWVYFLIDGKMAWNFDGETDVTLRSEDGQHYYEPTLDDENGVSVEISSPFNCLWATFGEDPEVMPEVSMPAMTRVPNLTVDMAPGSFEGGTVQVSYDKGKTWKGPQPAGSTVTLMLPGDNGLKNVTFRFKKDGLKIKKIGPIQIDLNDGKPSAPAYAGVAAVSGSTETAAASLNGTYVIYGDSDKVYRFHGKAPAAQELEVLFYDSEDAEILQRDMVWNEETLRHEADIARADFTGAVRVAMRVKENAEGITGRESGFALKQVTAGYLVVNEAPSFDGAAGTVLAPGDNVKFNFSAPAGSEWQKRVILNYKTTAGDDDTKTAAEALLEEWNSTISIPNSAASLVSMRYELYNVANDMVTNMVEFDLSAYTVEAPVLISGIPEGYDGATLRIKGTSYSKTVFMNSSTLTAASGTGYNIGEIPEGDYTWEISGASGYIASGSFTHSRGDDLDLSYDLPELGSLTVTTNGFTSEKEAAGSTEANAKYLTVNPQAKVIANFTMTDGTTHKVVGKTGQKMDQIPLGSTGTVTLEWDPEASDEISGVSPASYNVTINGDESRIFEYQKFTFRTIKGFLHYFDEYRNYGYTPWSARITLKQTVTRGGKTETIIRTASPAKAANPWQTQGTFSFTCYDNIPATIEIRSMEYDPKTIEITENGDQNLGQVNLTTGGERTVLVKVNYTTANTVNSKGEQYFENIGSSQVPIDSGFVSIASVGDWENRYYAGSTDKYSTYIENGQTYIHINEGVVKKERTLSVFGSGTTSFGGSEVVVRGNGDVVFDEMGVGTVTLNAYTNGGEVRATVVDNSDTAYMGFLCIVNGGYTYIHEDGTEEVIKHCEFVSGRGELVYPYSTTDNLARTRQVFTVKCRAEDAEDLADELSGNVNKFIELGEGTGKDQVILRNVKFQANTTVIFEDAKPTNFIRTAGLSPWIFDYQFELTEDIDTVRLTGVLYKRFPDMPDSDWLKYLRLYLIEGMNQVTVEFTANGKKTVKSYRLNQETGDYDIPNFYWDSGFGTKGVKHIEEVRITADLPMNYAFNKVHFQLSAELSSGVQVFDKDETIPIFTLSVPTTVSIMDRMGACGIGAWTLRYHPERMSEWTLPVSMRAFRTRNDEEDVITIWDNGEKIMEVTPAYTRYSDVYRLNLRLTDNLTPGVHVLWATRQYNGETISTEPQTFSLLSDASSEVYISNFRWTHWNSRIPKEGGGYEPDDMYFADLADMAGKTIWIWPGKPSYMSITVHNATSEELNGVSLKLTRDYSGDSMRMAAFGRYSDTYLPLNCISEDPVSHCSYWELPQQDLGYFKSFEFVLNYKTKYAADGHTLSEEERRQMELKRWYEANGLGEVPDDEAIVDGLADITNADIAEASKEATTFLPDYLKNIDFNYTNGADGSLTATLKSPTTQVKQYTVKMSEGDEIMVDNVWDLMEYERENGPKDPAEAGWKVCWSEIDGLEGSTLIRIATKNEKGSDNLWHLNMHQTAYITASVADAIMSGTTLDAQSGSAPRLNSAGSIVSAGSEPVGDTGMHYAPKLLSPGSDSEYSTQGDTAVPDHWLKKTYDTTSAIVTQADIGQDLLEKGIKMAADNTHKGQWMAAIDAEKAKFLPKNVGTAMAVLGAVDATITVTKGPSGADPGNLYYLVCNVKDEKARAALERQIKDYEDMRWEIYKQDAGLSTITAGAGFIANANPITKIACFVGGLANGVISGQTKDFNRQVYNTTLLDIQRQIQFEQYKAERAEADQMFKDMVRRRFGKDVADDPRRLAEEKKYWTLTKDEFGDLKWRLKSNVPEFKTYKDPSGYVFEGTEDERLEGVTATVYYTNTVDEQGNPVDFVKWDDPNTDESARQYNPQTTNEEGRYSWMVPDGWWKVVYEKDGYRTVESKPMEVPPVHLSVNIGLLSEEAPQASVSAAGGKVTVTFTKYMQMESLFPQIAVIAEQGDVMYNDNSGAIDWEQDEFDVSKLRIRFRDTEDGDGSALAGTVRFVDTVVNTGYKEGTYQKDEIDSGWFVKTLVFTPADSTVNVEQLTTSFGSGIVSYAGVPLNEYAEPELTTVFFDANGGTLGIASAEVDEDGCLTRLYTPTRQGFKFLGWFTDPEGGEQVTLSTVFTENTTIYAHWKQLPPEEESGTWGGSDQLSYRYSRKEYKVEIGGEEISESAPVFVVTFESNGRFQGLKMITDDGETANIPDGASIISLFWLDDEFAPKCDKVTIETEPEEDE